MDWRGLEELGMWKVYSFFYWYLYAMSFLINNNQAVAFIYSILTESINILYIFLASGICSSLLVVVLVPYSKRKKATAAAAFHTANYST